jgi:hypothetical protein
MVANQYDSLPTISHPHTTTHPFTHPRPALPPHPPPLTTLTTYPPPHNTIHHHPAPLPLYHTHHVTTPPHTPPPHNPPHHYSTTSSPPPYRRHFLPPVTTPLTTIPEVFYLSAHSSCTQHAHTQMITTHYLASRLHVGHSLILPQTKHYILISRDNMPMTFAVGEILLSSLEKRRADITVLFINF